MRLHEALTVLRRLTNARQQCVRLLLRYPRAVPRESGDCDIAFARLTGAHANLSDADADARRPEREDTHHVAQRVPRVSQYSTSIEEPRGAVAR